MYTWIIVLVLVVAKLALQLPLLARYGFHRDEFLYLSLGDHLAWGYWSNPPLIGWISALVQATLGDSIFAMRLVPILLSAGLIALVVLMARQMGGSWVAQLVAGTAALVVPPHLRAGAMFQPVIFDVFAWTLLTYLLVRWCHYEDKKWMLWFGLVFGLGLLNKLSLGFLLLALLPALWLAGHRRVLFQRATGQAALIALVLVLPYGLWQWHNGFPVITHMQELRANQLVNVRLTDFLKDQLLFFAPALLVWGGGLYYLFLRRGRMFRLLGWLYVFTLLLFIVFSGKSYYTLGVYPVLLAAGGVAWEHWGGRWAAYILLPVMLSVSYFMLPFSLPVLAVDDMVDWGENIAARGIDGPLRWEDGRIHPLPQDYADMLGWQELAPLVVAARAAIPDSTPFMVYAENYGQAGAIDYYGQGQGLPATVSFSDSYRLWAPPTTEARALIYVNDELGEDVDSLFRDIRVLGQVTHPFARENGTRVYLCQDPRGDFGAFWAERYQMVME